MVKKVFCVIDLKGAFQQVKISSNSKELITINTHLGLFRYNRLTYGISSAPGIFQTIMDKMLVGLKDVFCYIDDILIAGNSMKECEANLIKLLEVLVKNNVKINPSKCVWFQSSVEFLGHIINSQGVSPTSGKIESITNAPSPSNLTQLRSFLGMLNYYSKFIPNLSSELAPLYNLCKKNVVFKWSKECEETFQISKRLLTSNQLLTHYDPSLPIFVTCDASSYGIGAVLSHIIKGEERPILFASSTMSECEKRYSQLEREALAIMFALKKFNKYLFGRKFTINSDHEPLQFIFSNNKGIPITANARLQRWAIILSGYDYNIRYLKGKNISNADGLSRLPEKKITELNDQL